MPLRRCASLVSRRCSASSGSAVRSLTEASYPAGVSAHFLRLLFLHTMMDVSHEIGAYLKNKQQNVIYCSYSFLKRAVEMMNFSILKDIKWWCIQAGFIVFAGIAVLLALDDNNLYKVYIVFALIFIAFGVRRASILTKNNQQK